MKFFYLVEIKETPIPGLFSAEAATLRAACTGASPEEAENNLREIVLEKVRCLDKTGLGISDDREALRTGPVLPDGWEHRVIIIEIVRPHPEFYAVGTFEGIKFRPWGAWVLNDDDDFDD